MYLRTCNLPAYKRNTREVRYRKKCTQVTEMPRYQYYAMFRQLIGFVTLGPLRHA